jgi:hypothetical protein
MIKNVAVFVSAAVSSAVLLQKKASLATASCLVARQQREQQKQQQRQWQQSAAAETFADLHSPTTTLHEHKSLLTCFAAVMSAAHMQERVQLATYHWSICQAAAAAAALAAAVSRCWRRLPSWAACQACWSVRGR